MRPNQESPLCFATFHAARDSEGGNPENGTQRQVTIVMSVGSENRGQDFASLYAAHYEPALRLAFLLTGSTLASEEAVADAFALVYPKWQAGTVQMFGPYLKTVVTNQVRRNRRRERARRDRSGGASSIDRPLCVAENVAQRSVLFAALLRLPVRQRAAIVLRYYEDLTEAQTAEVLGTSVGTVKSQVSRGLGRLQAILTDTTEGV